jgi:hypothetical protein
MLLDDNANTCSPCLYVCTQHHVRLDYALIAYLFFLPFRLADFLILLSKLFLFAHSPSGVIKPINYDTNAIHTLFIYPMKMRTSFLYNYYEILAIF